MSVILNFITNSNLKSPDYIYTNICSCKICDIRGRYSVYSCCIEVSAERQAKTEGQKSQRMNGNKKLN